METISITMPQEEKDKLFKILEENNMTVDEAVDGFLRWLIRDTKAALAWIGIDINELKRPRINMITQQDLCEHIEDDDFFLRYGNPVAIQGEDGNILVCMAMEYYEQMTGEKIVCDKETDSNEKNEQL